VSAIYTMLMKGTNATSELTAAMDESARDGDSAEQSKRESALRQI